jgi:hypothetical protein
MAVNDKFYTGSTVSRHLPAGERAFTEVVGQSGKPFLDSEVNLLQEAAQEIRKLLWQETSPSGWMRGPLEPLTHFGSTVALPGYLFPPFGNPGYLANSFLMEKRTAMVAGYPVVVEYSNIDTALLNRVQLASAPVFGGAPPDVKRTDFVFLEVWKALVSDSANATGIISITSNPTVAGDIFDIAGNALTAVVAAPAVDEFLIGGTAPATAANMASAINASPPNSFINVTATAAGGIVTIKAAAPGTPGNLLTIGLSVAGGDGTYVFSGATLAGGVDEANKPSQTTLYRNGNTDSSVAVAVPDDIEDPIVGTETTKRVQLQYRIRVTGPTEDVNFKTEPDGFSNASIVAYGGTGADVATYPFVKADNSTVSGSSDATAYGVEDNGLWIAGSGDSTSAAALESVDGFVYAIPIAFAFRRNDSSPGNGWTPLDNTNGALSNVHAGFANPVVGVIPAGESDRPDGYFHDSIEATDVLDLRRSVIPSGMDYSSELRRQMQWLLDGQLGTWAIDTADKQDLGAGSGDVSYRFLVCNEVGRSGAEGGVPPTSGDTTRGVSVANFDHVRRRFGDQAVTERVLLAILPGDDSVAEPGKYVVRAGYAGAYAGWADGDEINLDLSALNASGIGDFSDASKTYSGGTGGSILGFAPPGTTITNVLVSTHDDGHWASAVGQATQFALVSGLGSDHLKLVLDGNDRVVNGGDSGNANYRMVGDSGLDDGSARRIFIELELSYPIGSGTTDTPDAVLTPSATIYPDGPVLENDISQRSADFEQLMPVRFREGKRELQLEYVANDSAAATPVSDTFVSQSPNTIFSARRLYGSGTTVVGVNDISTVGAGAPHDVNNSTTEYGSSSRRLGLDTSTPAPKIPLSGAGQTLVSVTYFPQDAIPNSGAAGGYQVAAYFRSTAPQTAGVKAGGLSLPASLTVRPLVMSKDLWTGSVGPGSVDVPFPYTVPMDHIPVNADVPIGDFPGEWYFASTAEISVDDFSADTGLLNLHAMVPVDSTDAMTFTSADTDIEFRSHYKVSDPASYRPAIFAQPLSNIQRHKVWAPFLAVATEDGDLWRKNEVLLMVITRFAELDDENTVRFVDTGNTSCVAVYRTRGLILMAGL